MPTKLERIAESLETIARDELWNSPGVASGETKGRYEALRQAARIVRQNEETEEQRRQRFEAWRISQCDERTDLRRDENGEYKDMITRIMWQTWQASQSFTEASQ